MIRVEIGARQTIRGLNKAQRKTLEEYATVENPKYKQAQRYSKWGAPKRIPKYLYYYDEDMNGDLELPRFIDVGNILGVKCEYENHTATVEVEYPKFMLTLREEQEEAARDYLKEYQKKIVPKSIIHLPTAKGKTVLALYLASAIEAKTLVLLHKLDLIDGWNDDIDLCFGGKLKAGLIRAKSRTIGEQITLATVQTLDRMNEDEQIKLFNQFGMVIMDECHHCPAATFNVIDFFQAKYKLGLSATPVRADGLESLMEFFLGGLCHEYVYREKDEDICSVEVRVKKSKFRFIPIVVKEKKGVAFYNYCDFEKPPKGFRFLEDIDYNERPRMQTTVLDGFLMNDREYRKQVLNDIYKEWKEGHSILALFSQKEYIDLYYNSLIEYVPSEQVMRYYGDSKEDDNVMRKKAESGEVKITLATLAKATEGTNVKAWEVLFFVSSIASEKNVEQAVGRVRRRKEGKIEPVRVYDYQQNVYSLRKHIAPRMKTYEKLKCRVIKA